MVNLDLNLLTALDALLAEGSVAGAARRLGLSVSAMSRTLSRLRTVTGDPLLVRAGRSVVPTPRAAELRERVREVTRHVHEVLSPSPSALDLSTLERTFTLRTNEGFIEAFAAQLVVAATTSAPGVRLRFAPKPDKDVRPLREGLVDLEVGVLTETGPEVRIQSLFQDRFVGVVRAGHPVVASGEITPARYAACRHVVASRRGLASGPVDEALAELGLTRAVVAVVPSFRAALEVARTTDLVALVTNSFLMHELERQENGRGVIQGFSLPVTTPSITVSQLWHPRMDVDPGHRWLRGIVLATCRRQASGPE